MAFTRTFTRRGSDASFVETVVLVGFAAHALFAAVLHLVLVARGTGGALFDDDSGYVRLASLIAQTWHGESVVVAYDPSTVNSYVYMASAIFWLFGPNVFALKLVNVTLGVVIGLFVHRTADLFFGKHAARAALLGLLLFPSLTLWSSLALKDAFTFVLSMIVVWSVTEFIRTRRYALLLVATLALLPIESARQYIFMVLCVAAIPATWLLLVGKKRLALSGAILITVGSLFLLNMTINLFTIDRMVNLEVTRRNMAEGARTSFIEPTRVVQGEEGSRFVVTVPNATPDPGRTPEVIVAAPGTHLIFSGRPSEAANPPPNSVAVKPGDIVVVGSAPPTAAAPATAVAPIATPGPGVTTPAPQSMIIPQTGSAFIESPAEQASALQRIWNGVSHLPKGAAYLIGSPFPWDVRSAATAALMFDLIAWYPTVICAFVGIFVLARRRAKDAAYAFLVLIAIAGILSLIEGNVGTLARHRGMIVPLALIFASGGVGPVVRWIGARSSRLGAVLDRVPGAT